MPLSSETQTLRSGSTAIINNTPLSLGPSGLICSAPLTIPICSLPSDNNRPPKDAPQVAIVILTNGQPYTATQGIPIIVAGIPLVIGEPTLTYAGETISLASKRVDAPSTFDEKFYTVYEVAGQTGRSVIVGDDGQNSTISAGGSPVTIDSCILSLVPPGIQVSLSGVFVRWTTTTAFLGLLVSFTDKQEHVHTAVEPSKRASTAVMDGSITLTLDGPAMTLDGEISSLGGNGVAVNGTTEGFVSATVDVDGAIPERSESGAWSTVATAAPTTMGGVGMLTGGAGSEAAGDGRPPATTGKGTFRDNEIMALGSGALMALVVSL
ncbi:MAG: hypothetical protein Q9165_004592 [Trypethelium subeluteriae]